MASASGSVRKLSSQKAAKSSASPSSGHQRSGHLLDAAVDAGGVLRAVALDEPVEGLLNGV